MSVCMYAYIYNIYIYIYMKMYLFGSRGIREVDRISRHARLIVSVRRECGFLNHAAIRQLRASANVAATARARRAI